MKVYKGERNNEGVFVWVEDDKDGFLYYLPCYLNVRNHSPDGFNWGYGGSGPSQLALAILIDHLPTPTDCRCFGCKSEKLIVDYRDEKIRCQDCGLDNTGEFFAKPLHLYQKFKFAVISGFKFDSFSITSDEINAAIATLEAEP